MKCTSSLSLHEDEPFPPAMLIPRLPIWLHTVMVTWKRIIISDLINQKYCLLIMWALKNLPPTPNTSRQATGEPCLEKNGATLQHWHMQDLSPLLWNHGLNKDSAQCPSAHTFDLASQYQSWISKVRCMGTRKVGFIGFFKWEILFPYKPRGAMTTLRLFS